MQKEELIQIHYLILQIKNELEKIFKLNGAFEEYEKLGVLPHHVHKSKSAHKKAILTLARDLAKAFSYNKLSEMERVAERFDRFLARL